MIEADFDAEMENRTRIALMELRRLGAKSATAALWTRYFTAEALRRDAEARRN